MNDTCGPVPVDQHNPNDPNCDYAPETSYQVRIPWEGDDIVLTVSPAEDAYLALPMSVLDRMADIGDVVMIVETVTE